VGDLVFPFSQLNESNLAGNSKQAQHLSANYLKTIKCETIVKEDKYIDKDYIIDYSKYYARSFLDYPRQSTRLHFFRNQFTEPEFIKAIEDNNVNATCGEYLGFIVVKPIKEAKERILGRTLLKTYPCSQTKDRIYIKPTHKLSLFGQEEEIESLPFQAQDSQVGACATVALWTASHALKDLYGTKLYSPSEITEKASNFPTKHRNFPANGGLVLEQMIGYINSLDLDKEIIALSDDRMQIDAARLIIRAMVSAGIPIIATLNLTRDRIGKDIVDKHAVVISGYGMSKANGQMDLFIHDDRIGPYCCTEWEGDCCELKNEWITEYGFKKMTIENLIIPLYPKIRIAFNEIIAWYKNWFEDTWAQHGYQTSFHLMTIKQYKKQIIADMTVKDKSKFLLMSLPRFIVVFRAIKNGKIVEDRIYDATEVLPDLNNPITVQYN
jgi:hypothetical protein